MSDNTESLLFLGSDQGDVTFDLPILPHQLTESEREQALQALRDLQLSELREPVGVVVTDEGLVLPIS